MLEILDLGGGCIFGDQPGHGGLHDVTELIHLDQPGRLLGLAVAGGGRFRGGAGQIDAFPRQDAHVSHGFQGDQRLADGRPADAEALGQLPLGGQFLSGRPVSAFDQGQDDAARRLVVSGRAVGGTGCCRGLGWQLLYQNCPSRMILLFFAANRWQILTKNGFCQDRSDRNDRSVLFWGGEGWTVGCGASTSCQ